MLISNCRHEQQACAFTAALNIEQPVESPGRNAERAANQKIHCYITNTQLGKHSNFCKRATFSLSLDIPRLLRWPPRRCSARPPTMPSKDTWGMCNVRWVLVLATFPTKGYPTNVNAEGRQHLKAIGNSLRHRPWLVLISNCWHEQQACAFTAALNIEQPVESPGRNAEHAANQKIHCYITNTQLGKHSNFCKRATFSLSLDIPRLLRWPPRRCSARPPTMPSKDTWGMCNVRWVLVLATFPTKG